jgi:hypothetical protein
MSKTILTIALTLSAAGIRADDKDAPKTDPPGTPLQLTITGKKTSYTLDAGGLSAADYGKKIADEAKRGKPLAVPAIDLAAEIKNTSDQPVQVWAGGDPFVLTLTLKGRGAVNVTPAIAFTEEFRLPKSVEIPAGKAFVVPLKSLSSGHRGLAHAAYWTEPGDYELVATLKTGVKPAPKGAKEGMDGFGLVTLTSPPFKLTVEAKK